MTKTRVIRVFSFIMALTLVFAMFSAPSYAISPRQFGAWIASALTALNITAQSTIGPMLQWGNQFNDYLSYPFKIEGTQIVHIPYTWSDSEIQQYLENSTISFTGDYIEIDGKHYQDIWLSNEAAEKFRVNAFDIKSAWNIASNSNGKYVSGIGSFDGVPIYGQDINNWTTQNYSLSVGTNIVGNAVGTLTQQGQNVPPRYSLDVKQSTGYNSGFGSLPLGNVLYWDRTNSRVYCHFTNGNNTLHLEIPLSIVNQVLVNEPFDFDWVSGTIPADHVLEPSDGLHLYVPVDPTEWQDSPATQTIINNYNTYIDNNPDITPDVDLDLDTPGLLDKIGDLLDILGPIIDLLKPNFGPKSQEPTPPVPPVPGDTISETPWESLVEWLQRILYKLDDILGIRDIFNNFKSAFDSAISTITQRLSQIKSILDSILDALTDLVDTIVHGNADWFSDIIDAIKQPFLPWLNIFKEGVSIWHYVVEWWGYISTAFFFFFGVLIETNYMFVIPFYAVAAACIVIAIYRRFGR